MNSRTLILLFIFAFFGILTLIPSINAKRDCPNPAPFCGGTEVCIFNQNTQECTCSCCNDEGLNCKQNFPKP
ncbi:hypothetical protein RhiirA5_495082 [Rhizophagus irregularis]|uniref:Uncharacterized protein n=1 Tax=Rhizophagus irregularis TaxID=588596 RepID=A0A2I1DV36_9GLOM|nr:hypothetical protein RhiirA5_495082 [Rhizophagus irregularis]PKC63969.1 hypothetical protein RhiirA1_537396 [Rhizophagus irregularis]PKY13741.1 hypothetical protein RhiirB3_519070 [Rhizophagus irregularis]